MSSVYLQQSRTCQLFWDRAYSSPENYRDKSQSTGRKGTLSMVRYFVYQLTKQPIKSANLGISKEIVELPQAISGS